MATSCWACESKEAPTKSCGRCGIATYCSKDCQKKDWPTHKITCTHEAICSYEDLKASKLDIEKQALATGTLQIDYLNPRSDRQLETHGSDTTQASPDSEGVKALLAHLGLGGPVVVAKCHSVHQGPYMQAFANVTSAIKESGGKAVYGWSLYEGKYCVEAEYHAVWLYKGRHYNVTRSMEDQPYDIAFVEDRVARTKMAANDKAPSNRLWWK